MLTFVKVPAYSAFNSPSAFREKDKVREKESQH